MMPPPVAEWPGAEIAPGVAFQGDGSVTLAEGPGGLPVLTFWRPILFREDSDKPIAGRMDCRVVASEGLYSEEAFDPEALHEVNEPLREAQGYKDRDVLRDLSDTVRKIDVVGRRKDPREHYVLSYILVRDGDRLIDIRRNCTFIHGKGIRGIDALPYVYRYTKFTYAFEPNTGNNA